MRVAGSAFQKRGVAIFLSAKMATDKINNTEDLQDGDIKVKEFKPDQL